MRGAGLREENRLQYRPLPQPRRQLDGPGVVAPTGLVAPSAAVPRPGPTVTLTAAAALDNSFGERSVTDRVLIAGGFRPSALDLPIRHGSLSLSGCGGPLQEEARSVRSDHPWQGVRPDGRRRHVRPLVEGACSWRRRAGSARRAGSLTTVQLFVSCGSSRRKPPERTATAPEQDQFWSEMSKLFDGEPTFQDSNDVQVDTSGDPDAAGFVQVMTGQVSDPDERSS